MSTFSTRFRSPLGKALGLFALLLVVSCQKGEPPPSTPEAETATTQSDADTAFRGAPPSPEENAARAPDRPVVLGYYTNWAHARPAPCDFKTSDVDTSLFTHINYAFASVNPSADKSEFSLSPSRSEDTEYLYAEVVGLKQKNPELKVMLSVGGWAFNDEKETQWIFSKMAETRESRASFIKSSLSYLRQHRFDGLDIDWEFPGVESQGGRPIDTNNFTALLKEFRTAFRAEAEAGGQGELLLTIAAPAGTHFLRHQDLAKIHSELNFINVMTYDYHGSWEAQTGANAPLVGPELSITKTINTYVAAGVPRNKLVLGIATYSRGWGGVDSPTPRSPATAKGPSGACGEESPTAAEVTAWIKDGTYTAHWDAESQTPFAYSPTLKAYLTYDNEKSLALKLDFLQEQKLGGAMFWAIDLDDYKAGSPIISQVSRAVRGQ